MKESPLFISLTRAYDSFGKVATIAALDELGVATVPQISEYVNDVLPPQFQFKTPAFREHLQRSLSKAGLVHKMNPQSYHNVEWVLNERAYGQVAKNALALSTETGYDLATFFGRNTNRNAVSQRAGTLSLAHQGKIPVGGAYASVVAAGLDHAALYNLHAWSLLEENNSKGLILPTKPGVDFLLHVYEPLQRLLVDKKTEVEPFDWGFDKETIFFYGARNMIRH